MPKFYPFTHGNAQFVGVHGDIHLDPACAAAGFWKDWAVSTLLCFAYGGFLAFPAPQRRRMP
jgi:hypothetical protein